MQIPKVIAIKVKGRYAGCSPTPQLTKTVMRRSGGLFGRSKPVDVPLEGDEQFPVYVDRPEASAWERGIPKLEDDGQFSVLFQESRRQFSWGPDDSHGSRGEGAVGSWERFDINEQPDGRILMYRPDQPDEPLLVEVIEQ